MDKKTEALKLALEALEVATTPLAKDRQEVLRAQAAIREALAEQTAQQRHISYVCPQCHWSLDKQPAQQERNFCQRCGKRLGTNDWGVHTCTPPASRGLG